ncbi:hypothetical protein [Paucibacter sp. DJ2R-2]|uniref:hypothetical protein n=1 Tax=Paucibacter sp. DJ2R-2 TaxID=2893558 RepID=UPI0021E36ABD|nr:hypothetical protein [Paucibacter sp. DJ2R-2]MCV2422666.1 hypothetical protein [Paucibacter sp. DJ4R-1]MCV2438864.1 hypothetical protein [Paucibacter sp. DJ2R-2]
MARKNIHVFSEGGLHTALLVALLLLILVGVVESWFFTPEGKTPVLWRLDPVVVTAPASGR